VRRSKKPRSNLIAPQQPHRREQEPGQTVGLVNLDEIPSPSMEPASPTPVVEETQQTIAVAMDIDMSEMGQGQ